MNLACTLDSLQDHLCITFNSMFFFIVFFLKEELPEIDGVEFTSHRDFHHGSRVTSIAWSPETTLLSVPKVVKYVCFEFNCCH